MTGSNRRPPACKAGALPAELIPRCCLCHLKMIRLCRAFLANAVPNESRFLLSFDNVLVGLVGFEPTTPALSTRCSNRLSYRPELFSFNLLTADKRGRLMSSLTLGATLERR